MSLNKKCLFERSKNVEIFGGAPINRERIIDKVLRSTRSKKGMGFILHVCYGDSQRMEYFVIAP